LSASSHSLDSTGTSELTSFNFAFDGPNDTNPPEPLIPTSPNAAASIPGQLPQTAEAGLHLQSTPANSIIASTPAAELLTHSDSFIFQPNFGHDVITNSNPISNA